MLEQPMFFPDGDNELFAVYHQPDSEDIKGAFVFCHPFAEEKLWSHRVYVSFARQLARAGFAVFRFDYMGHGDSDGLFEHATVESRTGNIKCAIAKMREFLPADQKIGLLGLRLGATLACIVARENPEIDKLILWEPITNGDRYMQEMLRINLTTQMAVYGRVIKNRETMVEEMKQGTLVNIDGYEVSYDFYEQVSAIDMLSDAAGFGGECLIVQLGRQNQKPRKDLVELSSRFANSEHVLVEEEQFWREIKRFYSSAPNLSDATMSWVGERYGE